MADIIDKLTSIFDTESNLYYICHLQLISDKIQFILDCNFTDKSTNLTLRQDLDLLVESLTSERAQHLKSKKEAALLKKKGIQSYVAKRNVESLEFSTKALIYTPIDDDSIPLLYGNRSAALFRLNMYKECIADISRALLFDCPDIKPKLLVRRIICHIKLGEKLEASENLNELMNTCDSTYLKIHSEVIRTLEKKTKELSEKKEDSGYDLPPLHNGPSAMFPQMSSALAIRDTNKYGRHVIAVEPIKKGSVLLVEEPFASSLLSENYLSNCYNCFKYTWNPIMCDTCVDVVWCDEQCRDNGNRLHRYECTILSAFTALGLSHLAVRTILECGWDELVKSEKSTAHDGVQMLISNFEYSSKLDQFQYCLVGHFLALLLSRKTDFVPENQKNDADILNLSAILAECIAKLGCNACSVTSLKSEIDTADYMMKYKEEVVGAAIYTAASIFNHSCQPSIFNTYYGSTLIIRAKTDLEVGSQVYNCYGPCSSLMMRRERRDKLKRLYFFSCDCVACDDEDFDLNATKWSGFKCPDCGKMATCTTNYSGLECLSCNYRSYPLPVFFLDTCNRVNRLHKEASEMLSKKALKEAETALKDTLTAAETIYVEQNVFLNDIRSTYAKSLMINRKFNSMAKEFETCLGLKIQRFGKYSKECCHYLLSYLYVMDTHVTDNSDIPEMINIRQETEDVLTLCYGSNWRTFIKYTISS